MISANSHQRTFRSAGCTDPGNGSAEQCRTLEAGSYVSSKYEEITASATRRLQQGVQHSGLPFQRELEICCVEEAEFPAISLRNAERIPPVPIRTDSFLRRLRVDQHNTVIIRGSAFKPGKMQNMKPAAANLPVNVIPQQPPAFLAVFPILHSGTDISRRHEPDAHTLRIGIAEPRTMLNHRKIRQTELDRAECKHPGMTPPPDPESQQVPSLADRQEKRVVLRRKSIASISFGKSGTAENTVAKHLTPPVTAETELCNSLLIRFKLLIKNGFRPDFRASPGEYIQICGAVFQFKRNSVHRLVHPLSFRNLRTKRPFPAQPDFQHFVFLQLRRLCMKFAAFLF